MLFNTLTQTRVQEHELSILFPNISFPEVLTDACLAEFNLVKLCYTVPPVISRNYKIVDTGQSLVNGTWTVMYQAVLLENTELVEALDACMRDMSSIVQQYLDDFAKLRGYDNIISAISYSTSTVPKFATEGVYAINARDSVWAAAFSYMNEIETNIRQLPVNLSDILTVLPTLAWPV